MASVKIDYPRVPKDISPENMADAYNELVRILIQKDRLGSHPAQTFGKVTIVTSDYDMLSEDGLILVDSTSGDVNITLRDADEQKNNVGKRVNVKWIQGTGVVSVTSQPGQNIDNNPSISLGVVLDTLTFASDGYNWWII